MRELLTQAQTLAHEGPLLCIDTSFSQGAVALVTSSGEPQTLALVSQTLPSDALVASIATVLERSALKVNALGGVVVGIGPGSFTGLRVALATAKGLALGGSVPIFGVSSLALIAATAMGRIAVLANARLGDVFLGVYDVSARGIAALRDDSCVKREEAQGICSKLGVTTVLEEPNLPPPAVALGVLLAADRIRARKGDDVKALIPLYLRVSEPERKRVLESPHD